MKKCFKKAGACEAGFGSSTSRGVPSGRLGMGESDPRPVSPVATTVHWVKGTYLEVAGHSEQMPREKVRRGPMVLKSSGEDDVRRVEPFDVIKVAVKHGEVDWLIVVPSAEWVRR